MTVTTNTLDSQDRRGTHSALAVEGPSPAPTSQDHHDAQARFAGGGGPNIRSDQCWRDAHDELVAAEPFSHPANDSPESIFCAPGGAQAPEPTKRHSLPTEVTSVRGSTPPAPAKAAPTPRNGTPVLADPLLALAADVLDDLERVRIANENRLRQLTRDETDADGKERGFGLTLDHPDVKRLAVLVAALAKAEHDAELNLKRQLRAHPLGPWVKQARGVGEKQAARLLASIGDPYIRPEIQRDDGTVEPTRPRRVSELWSYCGYHVLPVGHGRTGTHSRIADGSQAGGNPDQTRNEPQGAGVGVAATRARGQRANWSADAKMRAHLVAVSIVKAGGPYRDVYDTARAKYDDALHHTECKRCGPSGKPAQPGSPISAGHQHARALRAVAKEVLKDLWREAKRLHEGPDDDLY